MIFSLFHASNFRPGRLILAAGLAALLPALTGCHRAVTDPHDPKFIDAETKDWKITRGELDAEIKSFLNERHLTAQQVGAKMPMLETLMLDNLVLKKLILAKTPQPSAQDRQKEEDAMLADLKSRYPTEQEFENQLKQAGLSMDQLKQRIDEDYDQNLIRKTVETEAFKDDQPTDEEINDFYMKNRDKFIIPDKVRASRIVILVDDKTSPADKAARKKEIEQARARVVKGEDFGKVASEVSQDRYSAPKGGDVGFFQKGENEPGFDNVAFSTKTGQVSEVFETPMGYEFLKVTEVHPGGQVTVAEARDTIAKYLIQGKEEQQAEAYTDNLLKNSGVTYHLIRVELKDSPPSGTSGAPTSTGGTPADDSSSAAPAPDNSAPAPAPGQ